jgi:ABC-2 type transport system ATP-binding protein
VPEQLAKYGLELASDGHALVYTYDAQQPASGIGALIGALIADLNNAGICFRDLETEQSSLEEIFVDLVREPT